MPIVKLSDANLLADQSDNQQSLTHLATYHHYFDMPLREKRTRVTDTEANTLLLADQAVSLTKALLPYGSPNQIVDVWLTNTENITRRRERLLSPKSDSLERIVQSGAGNCEEHAQVTFALLAGTHRAEPVSKVSAAGADHTFVVIGDPRQSDRTTVADSWVTFPVAHLLRHGVFSIDNVQDTAPPNSHSDPKYHILHEWSQPKPEIQTRAKAIDYFNQRYNSPNGISSFYKQWTSLARLGGRYSTAEGKTFNFDRFPAGHITERVNAAEEFGDRFEASDYESDEEIRHRRSRSPSLIRSFAEMTVL